MVGVIRKWRGHVFNHLDMLLITAFVSSIRDLDALTINNLVTNRHYHLLTVFLV